MKKSLYYHGFSPFKLALGVAFMLVAGAVVYKAAFTDTNMQSKAAEERVCLEKKSMYVLGQEKVCDKKTKKCTTKAVQRKSVQCVRWGWSSSKPKSSSNGGSKPATSPATSSQAKNPPMSEWPVNMDCAKTEDGTFIYEDKPCIYTNCPGSGCFPGATCDAGCSATQGKCTGGLCVPQESQ